MNAWEALTRMDKIDEKYIAEADRISMVLHRKKAFELWLFGFLFLQIIAVVANRLLFVLADLSDFFEITARIAGSLFLIAGCQSFLKEYPDNRPVKLLKNLASLMVICLAGYVFLQMIRYTGYAPAGLQDMYIPIRIRRVWYLVQDLTVFLFMAGCCAWLKTRQKNRRTLFLKGYPYVYRICFVLLKAAQIVIEETTVRFHYLPKLQAFDEASVGGQTVFGSFDPYRMISDTAWVYVLLLLLNCSLLVYIWYLGRDAGE